MKIYNNNEAFGDGGPFEFDGDSFDAACEAFANEMAENFRTWAGEQYAAELRTEFIAGLTEVHHCDECGQDYHADAPERGHAVGCSLR